MHMYGVQKDGTDEPICRAATEIQIQRTDLWILMKVKEESEKVDLKLSIQKTKIMASGPITSGENRWGNSVRLNFFELQNQCRW